MIEIIFILLILMSRRKSCGGFGQLQDQNQNQVFFINEQEDVSLLINGYETGIRGSGLLYVQPCQKMLFVEYFLHGQKIADQWVEITNPRSYVMGPEEIPLPKVYPV
jgi:hypothetical protein